MYKSKIEKLVVLLRSGLTEAGADFSERDLERVAIVVYDSMSCPGRNFHNIQHVFEVAHGLNGISTLAAIFHDIIYYQVDGQFRSSIKHLVYEQIDHEGEQFFVRKPKNEIYKSLHVIFGVNEGDLLTVNDGLNEFLSAVIAIEMLKPLLSQVSLLKILGLIESTIPFRKDPVTILVERFEKINFPKEEIKDLGDRAVDFSNQDVFNFAETDSKVFLKNTWNLMSETNHSLRRDVDNYTIVDYRMALLKTYLFFKNLDPVTVFTRYKGYPLDNDWEKLTESSRVNVEIGRKYLMIKLISIAPLEAIAELTGGNTPMSLLMGDVRRRGQKVLRMEDHLGEVLDSKKDLSKPLLALLEEGRSQESTFDMKTSPIGAFVYKSLGENGCKSLFELAQNYFDKKLTADQLLASYPKDIIKKMIISCSKISSTRVEELSRLLGTI